ncbi:MAG: hypothetical protein QOK28_2825 [Actinomycetota bacterium]|jgi:hypothetical protein
MTESSNEKIVSRVQALLAKAESTTFPEEAEALTAKAQELITRYSIDQAVAQQRRAAGAKPALRRLHIEGPYISPKATLLSAVGRANNVEVVYNASGRASLVGFDTDLDTVELLFASLLVQATAAMFRVPRDEVGDRVKAFRHAFLFAFAQRIGQRLAQARAAATEQAASEHGASLVPLMDARRVAVEQMMRDEFPNTRTTRSSVSHYGGYSAGASAADRADIGARGRLSGSDRALTR